MMHFLTILANLNAILILLFAAGFVITCLIYKSALKNYVKEFVAIYSDKDSFFSKKRIESGAAFWFALLVTIYYVKIKIDTMDIFQFGYIITTWLFIAGYTVNQIQKEKLADKSDAAK